MIKAMVYVSLKPSILDREGKVINNALHSLGYTKVEDVRANKVFEIKFDETDKELVKNQLEEICSKLLANPNTESYRYEIEI
jgi:phosphoribosylformylglycinamidine synthase